MHCSSNFHPPLLLLLLVSLLSAEEEEEEDDGRRLISLPLVAFISTVPASTGIGCQSNWAPVGAVVAVSGVSCFQFLRFLVSPLWISSQNCFLLIFRFFDPARFPFFFLWMASLGYLVAYLVPYLAETHSTVSAVSDWSKLRVCCGQSPSMVASFTYDLITLE